MPVTVVHVVILALGLGLDLTHECGVQKLMKENLKVVWVKFSTLSLAVFGYDCNYMECTSMPSLKLKTRPRIYLASLSLSMTQSSSNFNEREVFVN